MQVFPFWADAAPSAMKSDARTKKATGLSRAQGQPEYPVPTRFPILLGRLASSRNPLHPCVLLTLMGRRPRRKASRPKASLGVIEPSVPAARQCTRSGVPGPASVPAVYPERPDGRGRARTERLRRSIEGYQNAGAPADWWRLVAFRVYLDQFDSQGIMN